MSNENAKDIVNQPYPVRSVSKSNRSTPLSSPPTSFPSSPAINPNSASTAPTSFSNGSAAYSNANQPEDKSPSTLPRANGRPLDSAQPIVNGSSGVTNVLNNANRDVSTSSNATVTLNTVIPNSSQQQPQTQNTSNSNQNPSNQSNQSTTSQTPPTRRSSFGLNFLSSFTNSIRPSLQSSGSSSNTHVAPTTSNTNRPASPTRENPNLFMSNSPTIANLHNYTSTTAVTYANENNIDPINENINDHTVTPDSHNPTTGSAFGSETNLQNGSHLSDNDNALNNDILNSNALNYHNPVNDALDEPNVVTLPENSDDPLLSNQNAQTTSNLNNNNNNGLDKDGCYSVRLTPLIDHSSATSGLYFAPVIRKIKPSNNISIGRYTEKNKLAAHAPQGSSAPIVFKSKVVSRTHALFQCNEDGQWFLKDCKSSSGTFLNHIRLSPASLESTLMPLIDGDIIQLGMDYRGGIEEVYRCVKMRCEFNKSWQRKVNQFNLEIHQKLKNLHLGNGTGDSVDNNPIGDALNNASKDELSECAICLLKLEPCQALFISPCSHSWHYKCIRPIIIKSYPQFYCPNCRSMCDLETDIEDDD